MSEKVKRPVSDAKKRADARYQRKAYDTILLRLRAGRKAAVEAHAAKYQQETGENGKAGYCPAGSVHGFILRAIDETMKRDASAQ